MYPYPHNWLFLDVLSSSLQHSYIIFLCSLKICFWCTNLLLLHIGIQNMKSFMNSFCSFLWLNHAVQSIHTYRTTTQKKWKRHSSLPSVCKPLCVFGSKIYWIYMTNVRFCNSFFIFSVCFKNNILFCVCVPVHSLWHG